MQNETQNQDTNTQVTQEESPAQNETPQNQDIDPAVTMSSDDLVGSDPNVTMHPEDLLDPEPDPNVTMHPEDLLDPETTEIIEPDPSEEDLVNYVDPIIGDQQYVINPDGSVTEIIEVDPPDPVITDWGLGRPSEPETITFLDRPSEPQNYGIINPSAEEAGRIDDSDPDIQGGCAFDYEYDEEVDLCLPTLDLVDVIAGDKPLPDSVGGYVGLAGDVVSDPLALAGLSLQTIGGNVIGDSLIWYGEGGGPIGWGFQGVGHTINFGSDVAGTIVSGAGELVEGVTDGVGDAVDAVGDAAEDAWDEISSWW